LSRRSVNLCPCYSSMFWISLISVCKNLPPPPEKRNMMKPVCSYCSKSHSRRQFLRNSTAALVTGAMAVNETIARSAYVAGSDVLRVGLVGCGGRGTGAASEALAADKHVKLTAMGDAFKDRLDGSLAELKKIQSIADKIDVPPERCFVGFDAYKS